MPFPLFRRPSSGPGQAQRPILNRPTLKATRMPFPAPKSQSKLSPTQKPVPFERGSKISIKKMMWEGRKGVVIPGTGGQKMWFKQYKKLLKERRVFEEQWKLKSGKDY